MKSSKYVSDLIATMLSTVRSKTVGDLQGRRFLAYGITREILDDSVAHACGILAETAFREANSIRVTQRYSSMNTTTGERIADGLRIARKRRNIAACSDAIENMRKFSDYVRERPAPELIRYSSTAAA